MTISYQPWRTGDRFPYWSIPLATDAGPDDLTDVDITKFSLTFRSSGASFVPGTGAFSVKRLYPAEVIYKPSANDVASPFSGTLIISVAMPPSNGAADTTSYDPIPFIITQR